jgi:ribonuclease R/exosome complex exonuclease DIS3/RRP44
LERKQTEFIGHLEANEEFAFFIPDSDKAHADIYIPVSKLNGAKDGDRVVVKMTDWKAQSKNPTGRCECARPAKCQRPGHESHPRRKRLSTQF